VRVGTRRLESLKDRLIHRYWILRHQHLVLFEEATAIGIIFCLVFSAIRVNVFTAVHTQISRLV
jgi:hypothetical protein